MVFATSLTLWAAIWSGKTNWGQYDQTRMPTELIFKLRGQL